MPAATSFFVPGPAQIAVGTGTNNALQFLGYAQGGVRITHEKLERPVRADYAGDMPADMIDAGDIIMATVPLVKFDPAVFQALLGRFTGGSGGGTGSTPGAILANQVGTMYGAESKLFPVLIRFPYQTKTPFAANMAGLRIPNAYVRGGIEIPVDTREQVIGLTFFGLSNMNTTNLTGTLFDQNMSGFPALT